MQDKATLLKAFIVRRWQDGSILDSGDIDEIHGSHFVIHRADLHSAMTEKALPLENVKLRVNALVTDVQFDRPAVVLNEWDNDRSRCGPGC